MFRWNKKIYFWRIMCDVTSTRYFLWTSRIMRRICLSLTSDVLISRLFVIEVVTNLCCEMQIQLNSNDDAEQSSECSWHWAAGVSNDQSSCSEMVFTTSDWLENSLGRALHGTHFVQSPSYFYYWLFRPSFRKSRYYSWDNVHLHLFLFSINVRFCTLTEKNVAKIVFEFIWNTYVGERSLLLYCKS